MLMINLSKFYVWNMHILVELLELFKRVFFFTKLHSKKFDLLQGLVCVVSRCIKYMTGLIPLYGNKAFLI